MFDTNEDSRIPTIANIEFRQVEAVRAGGNLRHLVGKTVSPTESEHVQGDAASIKEAIHNWLENLPYGVTKPRAASRFNGSPYLVAKGLWMNRVEFMKFPTFRTANEVLTSRNGKFIDSKAKGKVFWRVTYTLDFPWLEGEDQYDLEEVVGNTLDEIYEYFD